MSNSLESVADIYNEKSHILVPHCDKYMSRPVQTLLCNFKVLAVLEICVGIIVGPAGAFLISFHCGV